MCCVVFVKGMHSSSKNARLLNFTEGDIVGMVGPPTTT